MQFQSEIHTNKYVEKFLRKIPKMHLMKIEKRFADVEKLGIELHRKTGDIERVKGRKEEIYEIKIPVDTNEYRFLGSIVEKKFSIVHGFMKKSQKEIKKEIDLAIQRLKILN